MPIKAVFYEKDNLDKTSFLIIIFVLIIILMIIINVQS